MGEKVVLEVTDELADQIKAEYENRRERAVESMEAHGWQEQADKLQNTELAENTAEKALFVLRQEVGQ
jgi:hypothetical protein